MPHPEFSGLPLHDALLRSVEVLWEERVCRFNLAAFTQKGKSATPHVLEFQEVTALDMPHHEPWGPSNSVNSVSTSPGWFQVEMQSGDVIKVAARGFSLVAL